MLRRVSLLMVCAALLSSLSGCIILPEHHDHCCWRYNAYEHR